MPTAAERIGDFSDSRDQIGMLISSPWARSCGMVTDVADVGNVGRYILQRRSLNTGPLLFPSIMKQSPVCLAGTKVTVSELTPRHSFAASAGYGYFPKRASNEPCAL